MPMDVWDDIVAINLRAAVLCIKAVLPTMIAQKSGNIVNVASAAGVRGLPGSTAVFRIESGGHRAEPVARRRDKAARYPGERALPRPCRYGDVQKIGEKGVYIKTGRRRV